MISHRDDGRYPTLTLAAALFTLVVLLVPVVAAQYPALMDFPAHLARHYIGATVDHSTDLKRFYTHEWRPVPNVAADVVFVALNVVFSPLTSERLIIALVIALWALIPFVLYRAIWGHWSPAPALAGLAVYNAALRGGLENFLIAAAVSLLAFALWLVWRDRLSVWRVLFFGALATLVYFGHVLAWVVLGLLIAPYELQRALSGAGKSSARIGRLIAAALPFFPGLVLTLVFKVTTRTSGEFAIIYGGVESRIDALLSVVLMYSPLPDLLALIILIGILGWRVIASGKTSVHSSMALVLFTLLVACLLAPAVVQDIRGVHARLPAILTVALVASMNWQGMSTLQGRVIGALIVIALIVRSADVTGVWARHEAEITELRQALNQLDGGAVVLAVRNQAADVGTFHWLSLAYGVLDRQIFVPALYPDLHMLRFNEPYSRLTRLAPEPVDLSLLPHPHASLPSPNRYWDTWWKDFSHVLVLSRQPVEPHVRDHLRPIAHGSYFRLYKVRKACSEP